MLEVVPAILAKTPSEFKEKLEKVSRVCSRVQIDIMDGRFVPNTTLGENEGLYGFVGKTAEYHLMVNDPIEYIEMIAKRLGPIDPKSLLFIFHIESPVDAQKVIDFCRSKKYRVGIALNPQTALGEIEKYAKSIDMVLFMTVNPGFSGQRYISQVEDKIKKFRAQHPSMDIEVDGGIGRETVAGAYAAGANLLAAASAIFESKDIKAAIEELKARAKGR
ncbi:hypothetical protein FJZ26_04230 [Candidatus Parvarchaeota archaeon]|nr:hypothetical protein [Candidatus Parvarchaeota archaeon]